MIDYIFPLAEFAGNDDITARNQFRDFLEELDEDPLLVDDIEADIESVRKIVNSLATNATNIEIAHRIEEINALVKRIYGFVEDIEIQDVKIAILIFIKNKFINLIRYIFKTDYHPPYSGFYYTGNNFDGFLNLYKEIAEFEKIINSPNPDMCFLRSLAISLADQILTIIGLEFEIPCSLEDTRNTFNIISGIISAIETYQVVL